MRLILASTSPRRKELLSLLQVPFEIAAPTFSECEKILSPADEHAKRLAEGKARSCAIHVPEALVLGSDTIVTIDDVVLGKPVDREDACAMLLRLRGREHVVHTAVALHRQNDGTNDLAVETVRVVMHDFGQREVEHYLQTEEWFGKAGAYAIQGLGGRLVARIQGDFTAVVGLPLAMTANLLRRRDVRVPVDMEELYREQPYPNWAQFARKTRG